MANKRTSKRGFGSIRKLLSGRFQARYARRDRLSADNAFSPATPTLRVGPERVR